MNDHNNSIELETAMTTTTMTMIQALRSAMDVMLERDDNVVVFGQDVGYFGGVFRCTEGLQNKYGSSRVFDAPISESGIVGVAVGMGAYGLRPVAEIQFADYVYPATDQIISEAARLRYRSAGQFTAPLTMRMPCGGGIYGGQTHSQSIEAVFTQVCGLRTVMPSNPYDAKGLLIARLTSLAVGRSMPCSLRRWRTGPYSRCRLAARLRANLTRRISQRPACCLNRLSR